ncbi:MAG: tetratricopeptide repeat protein [Prevotella sp.]|jgi:tetratricopeptide (TPR) repeat protein|uniref:tetratricopeptide repeat protein n=1 Tax=Dysgonomonas sp. TaxID=1891233 RepID=UPI0028376D21|nr:tetratricopeptide repeat protein [Dysgonomonas sp.]MDR1716598.1 tetratricopeptide repeat protein [Prevotella sp.]MDR2001715.1 tetratricopeptide repeat protein [Prevotella sp.]HMM04295.1 tetratricopeptide repeat protein [Dysgonomonas sp.]
MPDKDISSLIKRYQQAHESGKNPYFDADEFSDLAEYFDSIDELDTAREIIDAGLAIHPGNTPLLIKKAKLAVYDGEYELALELLDSSSEYDFDLYLLKIECYLQLEQYQDAFALSEELLEKEDDEPLDNVLAELGFLHVEADCFKEAVLYLQESLKHNPENIEVLSDLAYAHEMLGDFEAAIDATNKILDIEPYTYEAWVSLGKLYSLKEQFEKAIDAFDFALTINDADGNVLKLKAHCLSLVDRVGEAIEIFNDLLLSDPDDTSIHFLLAECYEALEMYDEALTCLQKYEDIEGETTELLCKRAYIYLGKGDYQKALAIVEKGLKDNPYSLDLNMIAGEVEFLREEYKEAELYYLSIYSQNKENFQLLDRLAMVYIKEEDYQQAAFYTEKLLELDPTNLAVKQRLALLYFELGDEVEFNIILDQFTDKELLSLFELIYTPQSPAYFDRDMLLAYLNKAREARTLFKNLKY